MINFIDVDVWNTSIVFIVEPTIEEFERFYYNNTRRINDEEYKIMRKDIENPNSCTGFTMRVTDGGFMVFLRNACNFLYVSHEIFHAVNGILLNRGVNIDEDGEPWAYTIGFVTDWYIKWICDEKDLIMFVPRKYVSKEYSL